MTSARPGRSGVSAMSNSDATSQVFVTDPLQDLITAARAVVATAGHFFAHPEQASVERACAAAKRVAELGAELRAWEDFCEMMGQAAPPAAPPVERLCTATYRAMGRSGPYICREPAGHNLSPARTEHRSAGGVTWP